MVADAFRKELAGKHGAVIQASLAILHNRFAQNEKIERYRKDGPVSVAKFELGESDEPEQREATLLTMQLTSPLPEGRGFLQRRGSACCLSRFGGFLARRLNCWRSICAG